MEANTDDDDMLTLSEDGGEHKEKKRRRRRRRHHKKSRRRCLSKLTPFELKVMYGVMCLILAASSLLPAFIFLGVGSAMSPVHVHGINVFLVVGGVFLSIGFLSGCSGAFLCWCARTESRRSGGCVCNKQSTICQCRASYDPIAKV